MHERWVLYLETEELPLQGLKIVGTDHTNVTMISVTQVAQWAEIIGEKELIIGVPAEAVLLTQVNLPKMRESQLQQAVPFALEEQLVTDLESLHFAWGKRDADGIRPVLVVAKSKMQQWLNLLHAVGLKPTVLLPVSLALPLSTRGWHVALHRDKAIVRRGLFQGWGCEQAHLSEWIEAIAKEEQPACIEVTNYTDHSAATLFPHKHHHHTQIEIIETRQPEAAWYQSMAMHLQQVPAISLLQGMYAYKKRYFASTRKIVKAFIGIVVANLCLLLLYPMVSYFILKQQLTQLEHKISTIYYTHFPQATQVISPKSRMQALWQKKIGSEGDQALFYWIGEVAQILQRIPEIKLSRLDYQQRQLTMTFTALSSEAATHFIEGLMQKNWQVRQQSTRWEGERIQMTIVGEKKT